MDNTSFLENSLRQLGGELGELGEPGELGTEEQRNWENFLSQLERVSGHRGKLFLLGDILGNCLSGYLTR